VLWGPVSLEEDLFQYAPDDVVVLPGAKFGEWLNSIPDAGVTPDLIASAWTTLEEQVTQRDARDLGIDGPGPRPIGSWLLEGVFAVAVGLLGCITSVIAFRLVQVPWFWLVACALLGSGAILVRVSRLRLIAIGWLTGIGGVTVFLGGAYVYELLVK